MKNNHFVLRPDYALCTLWCSTTEKSPIKYICNVTNGYVYFCKKSTQTASLSLSVHAQVSRVTEDVVADSQRSAAGFRFHIEESRTSASARSRRRGCFMWQQRREKRYSKQTVDDTGRKYRLLQAYYKKPPSFEDAEIWLHLCASSVFYAYFQGLGNNIKLSLIQRTVAIFGRKPHHLWFVISG